jgi:hypothetical protein
MSTPTTARGALLRRTGILLLAAALVGAPATSALADTTPEPSPTASGTATSPPVTTSPSPSVTVSSEATPAPDASVPAPSTSSEPTPSAASTPGSDAPERLSEVSSARVSAALVSEPAGASVPQAAYAADFLARTLAARGHHYDYPGGDWFDGGNTIDAIIAFAATGSGGSEARAALDYLEANLVGGEIDSYDGLDQERYAGPIAKALLGILVAGEDPTDVLGMDLVAELQGLEGGEGRFSDVSQYGDNSNTIGQALALIALLRAGESVSDASIQVLVAQQCADGGFRGTIGDATCTSDPDATAFAAQALLAAGSATAAGEALDHLAAIQGTDGSIRSTDGVANANTTGVAAQAFAAGGRDTELADAQAFLVSLQYGCSSPAALRGGIAFSVAKRSTTVVSDEDLRATPQATLGLTGQSLLSASWPEQAADGTTALPCAATPTTKPSSTDGPPSTGGSAGGTGGSQPSTRPDPAPAAGSATTGSLAQTGSDLLRPALLGLLLLVVGALALVASRRRGAHA